jgi:hypothetical protein
MHTRSGEFQWTTSPCSLEGHAGNKLVAYGVDTLIFNILYVDSTCQLSKQVWFQHKSGGGLLGDRVLGDPRVAQNYTREWLVILAPIGVKVRA